MTPAFAYQGARKRRRLAEDPRHVIEEIIADWTGVGCTK
jgi:hypothetical protein